MSPVLDLLGSLAQVSPALPEGVLDLRVLGTRVARRMMSSLLDLLGPHAPVSPALPEGVPGLRVPGTRVARTNDVTA